MTSLRQELQTGDELFETQFNAIDGVGANVGQDNASRACPEPTS
jgi:hypothetical protein